jgi:valine--pyruvate aminotransferase
MQFSEFGESLAGPSGIGSLMHDLGHALAEGGSGMRMLGGGNPAIIPAVADCWRRRMRELTDDVTAFDRMLAIYDPPKGNARFLRALADFLSRRFGWELGPENLAVTPGGQTAFFFLFNLMAGRHRKGPSRKILFPITPEYVGYADQGLSREFFVAVRPKVEFRGPHDFKYHVDFDAVEARLESDATIAALCVSRPTNPTGNVIGDQELGRLDGLARRFGIPLIIDNAYGIPFPGIIFTDASPLWNDNVILTLSLSKLGLPGTRTGIVIGRPEVIDAISAMTAITGLANGTIGQAILTPLIESGELEQLVGETIRPFYARKAAIAREAVASSFPTDSDYLVHANEGALFLWLWLRGLREPASAFYHRLKKRGVLVVPGHYFAFGEGSDPAHADQCIRINYAMDDDTVTEGIRIIAEEYAAPHSSGRAV